MDENPEIIGGGGNNGGAPAAGGDPAGADKNGGSGGGNAWHTLIPEATRTASADVLKNFANDPTGLENLLKGYTEGQKLIGQKGLTRLPENATEEQKKAFDESRREVLGVPKDKDGYKFDTIEGMNVDENLKGAFTDFALKIGLPADQANELFKFTHEFAKADQERVNAEFDTAGKKVFGDKAGASMEQAKVLAAKHIDPALKELLPKLDNNALLVLASMGLNMQKAMGSEDTPSNENGQPGGGGRSADDVRAEKLTLMRDPSYTNAMDPKHEATKKKVLELNELEYKLKNPGAK